MSVANTNRTIASGSGPATDSCGRSSAAGDAAVVLVECAGQQFGLPAGSVDQVRPAAHVRRLAGAPLLIEGVVDLGGELVPVLDGRRRIGISHRDVRFGDHFVVVRSRGKRLAIHVDGVVGVVDVPASDIEGAAALRRPAFGCAGIARLKSGLFFVHDIDALLSGPEFVSVERALAASRSRAGHASR